MLVRWWQDYYIYSSTWLLVGMMLLFLGWLLLLGFFVSFSLAVLKLVSQLGVSVRGVASLRLFGVTAVCLSCSAAFLMLFGLSPVGISCFAAVALRLAYHLVGQNQTAS